ncbi:MAG: hypothetical protein GX936_06265 [Clostridiales bacterium]|jgi:uncharacterized protein YkwD|nr:hypothetical protein [Clostridiales bacterium]
MEKGKLTKLIAFFVALILCMSLTMTAALAADEAGAADAVLEEASSAVQTAHEVEEDPVALFKAEVVRLVNLEREKAGAAALAVLKILYTMADVRAQESAVSFSHTRPNNTRCFTIFGENNLKYRAAGENLAYGFRTPEAVVKAWMASEGHRRNILDPDFKYIGIGYYVNENGRIYCSQLFYTPRSK